MKKILCMLPAIMILILAVGCSPAPADTPAHETDKVYTYAELASLPGDRLLPLFVENGLVISERLNDTFTEAELQEFFKAEFDLLCTGVSIRNDVMYFDLAKQTKEVYKKLTHGTQLLTKFEILAMNKSELLSTLKNNGLLLPEDYTEHIELAENFVYTYTPMLLDGKIDPALAVFNYDQSIEMMQNLYTTLCDLGLVTGGTISA